MAYMERIAVRCVSNMACTERMARRGVLGVVYIQRASTFLVFSPFCYLSIAQQLAATVMGLSTGTTRVVIAYEQRGNTRHSNPLEDAVLGRFMAHLGLACVRAECVLTEGAMHLFELCITGC